MGERSQLVLPKDAEGKEVDRAMGAPLVRDSYILGSGSIYSDIFDLSLTEYRERAFIGLHVSNPSATRTIHIAMTDAFGTNKVISVGPSKELAFDKLTFGQNIYDDILGKKLSHLRAKLDANDGTLASGTIDYSTGPVQPTNGQTVVIGGIPYEFSSDASASGSNQYVAIGVSADASWTNLVNAINALDQRVTASIDTGTDLVTITSNYGGTQGNAYTIADGTTGAVFSGATLAGGAGGVTPIIHIW